MYHQLSLLQSVLFICCYVINCFCLWQIHIFRVKCTHCFSSCFLFNFLNLLFTKYPDFKDIHLLSLDLLCIVFYRWYKGLAILINMFLKNENVKGFSSALYFAPHFVHSCSVFPSVPLIFIKWMDIRVMVFRQVTSFLPIFFTCTSVAGILKSYQNRKINLNVYNQF